MMTIQGVGTHIVESMRLRRMIEHHGETFLRHVFSEREIRFCQARRDATEWFASIWAAKKAILQSLGLGSSKNAPWLEIDIESTGQGEHEIHLTGSSRERRLEREVAEFRLAMSHCRSYSTAFVIAIGIEMPFSE